MPKPLAPLGEPEEAIACGFCGAPQGAPCTDKVQGGYIDKAPHGWERGVHIRRQEEWKRHQGLARKVWEACQVK